MTDKRDRLLNDKIDNFINVLSQDKDIDLSTFYHNLETLQINTTPKNNKFGHPAWYDGYNNVINFENDFIIDNSIYHELLHCASTKSDNEYKRCGFEIVNNSTYKFNGKGLNEGYTELLNERLFGNSNAYWLQKFYMIRLEDILDPTFIKKSYFNADFDSLLNELHKFASKKEIMMFVYYIDLYTCFQRPNFKKLGNDISKVQEGITYCSNFLIKCYANKLLYESKNDKLKNITTFINHFEKTITDKENGNQYSLKTDISTIIDVLTKLEIDANIIEEDNNRIIKLK